MIHFLHRLIKRHCCMNWKSSSENIYLHKNMIDWANIARRNRECAQMYDKTNRWVYWMCFYNSCIFVCFFFFNSRHRIICASIYRCASNYGCMEMLCSNEVHPKLNAFYINSCTLLHMYKRWVVVVEHIWLFFQRFISLKPHLCVWMCIFFFRCVQ